MHAAIGLVQLEHLDEFVARRRWMAARYQEALVGVRGVDALAEPVGARSNWYKFPVLLDPKLDREQVQERLRGDHGVTCSGEVYATPPSTGSRYLRGLTPPEGGGPAGGRGRLCPAHLPTGVFRHDRCRG